MEKLHLSNLEALEAESIHIIREVAAGFERPVMLYSVGKDSSAMVRLAQKAFSPDALHRQAAAKLHPNITRHKGHVQAQDRTKLFGQKPITIWLTGLSGSGKSTLAYALEKKLVEMRRACFVLDGDNVRHGLNRDLGFSPEDRSENIRRVAEVAKLLNEAGLIVVTAFISPFEADRCSARKIIGGDRFIEAFVDAPIEVCEQRDPKGLYNKARKGEIAEFTGISSPYEAPEAPELRLESGSLTVEECVDRIERLLKEMGVLD